jgi:pyruvate kinase
VTPLRLLFDEDVDHRILRGLRRAHPQIDACTVLEAGLARRGDLIVITAGIPLSVPGSTNLVKIHSV